MANAPSIFSASAVTELLALAGRAKLTFPTSDAAHYRVERSAKLSKPAYAALAFNQPDAEFPAALLKSYQKVAEDAQWIQAVLRYETLPGLPLATVTNSYLDLIPPEFKAAEQYTTTATKIDPSAPTAPDATSETILSSTVQAESAVEGIKTNVTRPAGPWPVLTGYEVSEDTLGEKAAVVRSIGSSNSPAEGLFVLTSTVTPLGNGDFLTNTTEFQNPPQWPVLTAKTLGAVELVPEKFRFGQELDEVRTKVTPSSSPDALSSTVLASILVPETKDRSEKRTTSVTGSFSVFTGHLVNESTLGESAVVVEQIVSDGAAPATGLKVIESRVETLGNGQSVETTTGFDSTTSWPVLSQKTLGGVALIPDEFRAAAQFNEIRTKVAPATNPDALSSTLFESVVVPETKDRSELRSTSLQGSFSTLTGYELSEATLGAPALVVRTLVTTGSGDSPDSGFEVLTSNVRVLGNGLSVKETTEFSGSGGSVWPVLTQKTLGALETIPADFRASLQFNEVRTKVSPSSSPDSLSSTLFESVIVPETVNRAEKRSTSLAGGSFSTLTGYEVSDVTLGEQASVARSLVTTGSGDSADTGFLIVGSKVTVLGNGLSLKETTQFTGSGGDTWPVLTQERLGSLDSIPAEFRAALTISEVRTKVDPASSPSPDALGGGVVESVVVPEEKHRSEKRTTSISGSYPTLTGHEASEESLGTSATVTKQLVADGAAPATGYQVLTSTVEPLGNGLSVSTTKQVVWPTLTNQNLGSVDLVPLEFRAQISLNEVVTRLDATGSPAPDALSATVLESKIEQQGEYLAIKRTTSMASGTTATLAGYDVSNATLGAAGTVTRTLVTTGSGDSPDTGLYVVTSNVRPLGNGRSVKETTALPSSPGWPVLTEKRLGGVNLIPEEFRASQEFDTARTKVAPSSSPDALGSGVVESVIVPETEYRAEKQTTSATGAYSTLTGYQVSETTWGGKADVVRSLVTTGSGDAPDSGILVLDSRVRALGNGLSLKETTEIDTSWQTLTGKHLGSVNLIPAEFRALNEFDTVRSKVAPSSSPTALSSTVVESELVPETKDRSELRVTSVVGTFTTTLTGYDLDSMTLGAPASVVRSLVTTGSGDTPDSGFNVIDSKVNPLGNGYSVKETHAFTGSGSSVWPVLTEKRIGGSDLIPREFRASQQFNIVKTKVAPSSSPDALSSTVVESVILTDTKDRAEKLTTSATGAFSTLTGFEYSQATWGGAAQVVRSLVTTGSGDSPDTGLLVLDSKVSVLGNGYSVKETVSQPLSWPSLTGKRIGSTSLGKFSLAVEIDEVRTKVPPSTALATLDPLGSGIIESVLISETVDRAELRTSTANPEIGDVSLIGAMVDARTWGQQAAIIESIVPDGTGPATGIKVIESTVETRGDGSSFEKTISFDSSHTWPSLTEKRLGGRNLIPEKFQASLEVDTVMSKVDPSTSPTALSSTVIESTLTPETKDRSELRVVSLSSSTTPTLTGYEVDVRTWGQSASVVESLVTTGSGDAPDTGLKVIDSTVEPLGNGLSLKRSVEFGSSVSWPSLTEKALGSLGVIPERFRAAIEIDTVRSKVAPSTAPTALSSTVLESLVVPETKDRSELRVSSLTGTPGSLTGYEVDRMTLGAIATVSETLVVTGSGDTPATGIYVLDSTAVPLGNGQSILKTTSLPSSPGWPTLTEKQLGEVGIIPELFRYAIGLNTVKTKVAPSTSPAALSDTVIESAVLPETKDRSELRVSTLASDPTGVSFAGFELNAKGQSVAVTKTLVDDGTAPSLSVTFVGAEVNPLGNGLSEETDRIIATMTSDTFRSFRQTGGKSSTAGDVLEETVRTYVDPGVSGFPSAIYPNAGAAVISDRIVEETLQHSIRELVRLTDPSGTPLTVFPIYNEFVEYDRELKIPIYRSYQFCNVQTVTPPTLTTANWEGTGIVVNVRVRPLGEAPYFGVNGVLEVEWVPNLPAPIVDFVERGFEFPAIFTFANNYSINDIAAYYSGFPPPWPGNGTDIGTFQLIAHRPVTRPMRRVRTYTLGPSNNFQQGFKVITPGVSSRFFQIPPNCIHQPIDIHGTYAGATYQIENIPASYPSQYSSQDVLTVSNEERPVLGMIYENVALEVSEDLLPSQFGPVYVNVPFTMTSANLIAQQPAASGETLWFVSTNAGDTTQTATIYGRKIGKPVTEVVTLNGTSLVQTVNRFTSLIHVHLSAACAGTVTCSGSGIPASATIQFTAQPANNDTLTVGRAGSTQTYTFKTSITGSTANEVQIATSGLWTDTAASLARAINVCGTAGVTASQPPPIDYSTGTTTPLANIVATVASGDSTVVNVADTVLLQANSQGYLLSTTSAAIVVSFDSGTNSAFYPAANGPIFATIAASGIDANKSVYLNAQGLLDAAGSTAIGIVPGTFGNVAEGLAIVSVSTDGTPTIPDNVPGTLHVICDWMLIPATPSGGVYSFNIVCALAGTPGLVAAYDTYSGGSTAITNNNIGTIGNGKVFVIPASTTDTYVRFRIDNSGYFTSRAVYAALQYEIPT